MAQNRPPRLKPPPFATRAPGVTRQRVLAVAGSIFAHGAVIAALLGLYFAPPDIVEPDQTPAMLVSLSPSPEPPGAAGGDRDGAEFPDMTPPPPDASVPAMTIVRPAAASVAASDPSAAQLAGAARVGDGASGGACDMARAVQQMLRRDPLVRAAVADAGRVGRATVLWDGDWVRSGSQEGKGMAAVRQAILWEVGFAPAACRNAPMRGMVLLSLADGTTRFAIGAGDWRWSDLLGLRAAAARR